MNKKRSALLSLFTIIAIALGQNRGFPVQAQFENCIKPSHISQDVMDSVISDFYFHVRDNYVAPAQNTPGGYYILSGGGTGGAEGLITISEGHGYGMIASVLMAGTGPLADPDAKEYFDGMYYFYDAHRSVQCQELMSWQVLTDGNGGESFEADYSATDGDMDIAYALILAHYQWGSEGAINYLKEAQRIITKGIKEFNMNHENMRTMLGDWVFYYSEGSGDWWYNETTGQWEQSQSGWFLIEDYYWGTRPSDWMTGHMHAFQDVTGDAFWGEAADTVYSLIANFTENHAPNTRLIADFVDGADGAAAAENYINEFPETNQYYQNACRVPLRMSADYAHYGSTTAVNTVNGMMEFIRTKTNEDPSKITFGYDITTGEELYPGVVSTRFTSPFVAGAMVDTAHQQYLNDGWDFISQRKESYYSDYLTLLSMMLISGNWWAAAEEYSVAVNSTPVQPKAASLNHSVKAGQLSLAFTLNAVQHAEVELFTINGRKVASAPATSQGSGAFTATLPTNGLSESVYIVRVGNRSINHSSLITLQ